MLKKESQEQLEMVYNLKQEIAVKEEELVATKMKCLTSSSIGTTI